MAKRGRPIKEDAMRGVLNLRLGKEDMAILNELCALTGKNKSEVIRESVTDFIEQLKKKGE